MVGVRAYGRATPRCRHGGGGHDRRAAWSFAPATSQPVASDRRAGRRDRDGPRPGHAAGRPGGDGRATGRRTSAGCRTRPTVDRPDRPYSMLDTFSDVLICISHARVSDPRRASRPPRVGLLLALGPRSCRRTATASRGPPRWSSRGCERLAGSPACDGAGRAAPAPARGAARSSRWHAGRTAPVVEVAIAGAMIALPAAPPRGPARPRGRRRTGRARPAVAAHRRAEPRSSSPRAPKPRSRATGAPRSAAQAAPRPRRRAPSRRAPGRQPLAHRRADARRTPVDSQPSRGRRSRATGARSSRATAPRCDPAIPSLIFPARSSRCPPQADPPSLRPDGPARRKDRSRHRRGPRHRPRPRPPARRRGRAASSSTTSTPTAPTAVVAEIDAAGGEAVANTDNVATWDGGGAVVAAGDRHVRPARHPREQRRRPARRDELQHHRGGVGRGASPCT